MAANKIQIKRSVANGVVSDLANGELAYTEASNTFWIGAPSGGSAIPIGGARYPGTLTANQALVANSTSYIDVIKVANLQPNYIYANGTSGTTGQLLASNASGGVYWLNQGAVSINVNSSYSWTNSHTFSGAIYANTVNATSFTIGTDFSANSSNVVIAAGGITANLFFGNGASVTSVNASALGGNTVGDIVGSAVSNTQSNNNTFAGNNIFQGTNTSFSSNVLFTGGIVDMSSANLSVNNMTVSGNLTVSGTLTTINTQDLIVGDPMIKLGANNDLSDTLDLGFYGEYFNGATNAYAGFYRIHASSDTNPIFKIFSSTSEPTTTVTDTNRGTLEAYLTPYGVGGAFVANSSNVQITANSTVGVNITSNSITLTTALAATSGGTGQNTYAVGDILYASATNAISMLVIPNSAANGQVLQIDNNLPTYGTLDGGEF